MTRGPAADASEAPGSAQRTVAEVAEAHLDGAAAYSAGQPPLDMPYADLWLDGRVVVAAESNELVGDELTMEVLGTLPSLFTYQSRTAFTSLARQPQQLGIEAVVESFLALPHFIAGTNRLGLIQAGLAHVAESVAGVRTLEAPFDATPVVNALWWHPVHGRDPEHAWMRGIFEQAAASVSNRPTSGVSQPV